MENLKSYHTKLSIYNNINKNLAIKFGTEQFLINYYEELKDEESTNNSKHNINDFLISNFVESEIKVNNKIALRFGGRTEFSTYTDHTNIAPRIDNYPLEAGKNIGLYNGNN